MIVAVVNQKGGVGKTTISVSLFHRMKELGMGPMLLDFDPQNNAAMLLDDETEAYARDMYTQDTCLESEIYKASMDMLRDDVEVDIDEAIAKLKSNLTGKNAVIDCPPAPGIRQLLALAVADKVVVPLEPSILSLSGLAGIKNLFKLSSRWNKPKVIYLLNRVRRNAKAHEEAEAALRHVLGDLKVLHESAAFPRALVEGKPVWRMAATPSKTRDEAKKLFDEILEG